MGAPARSTRQQITPAAPAPLANSPSAAPPATRAPAVVSRALPLPIPGWAGRVIRTLRGQFLLLGALIFGLCLVQAYLTATAFTRTQAALVTVTRQSVPSIEAAQAMAQLLEELDTQAALYLTTVEPSEPQPCVLIGGSTAREPITLHECAALNLDAGILLFNRELYAAAHNVTYRGERSAVEQIARGFQEYVAHLSVMRYEYESAADPSDPTYPAIRNALTAYQAAREVLYEQSSWQMSQHGVTLATPTESNVPACVWQGEGEALPSNALQPTLSCLITINQAPLNAAYADARNHLNAGWYGAVGIGLFLGLLLAVTTLRMITISRRLVNPGLTLALLGGLVLGFTTQNALSTLYGSFDQMVQVSYRRSYEAATIKRQATTAHASQARWLLAQHADNPAEAADANAVWEREVEAVRLALPTVINTDWLGNQPLTELENRRQRWVEAATSLYTSAPEASNRDRLFVNFITDLDALHDAHHTEYQAYERSMAYTLAQYRLYSMLFFPLVGLLALWGIALRLRDF